MDDQDRVPADPRPARTQESSCETWIGKPLSTWNCVTASGSMASSNRLLVRPMGDVYEIIEGLYRYTGCQRSRP